MRLASALLIGLMLAASLGGCLGDEDCPEFSVMPEYVEIVSDPDNLTVANVRFGDLDGDGHEEMFSTYPMSGTISRIDCHTGTCVEETIESDTDLAAPVRTHVVDLDGDGVNELLVADIGILPPVDDLVGKVVVVSFDSNGDYVTETILEGIGRVACAEAADLDGDGDLDIVVCEFGHTYGSVLWLEKGDDGNWYYHQLDDRPGAIHAFPFDADGDGDLDIAVSLSQLSEEILLFRNDGTGTFHKEILAEGPDRYYGMSGLSVHDLDEDGDFDIIYTNGDTLDMDAPEGYEPHVNHGIAWLENDGTGSFTQHELTRVWGAYANTPFDFDSDGDLDIIVGTLQIDMVFPSAPHIDFVLLENDGEQNFQRHNLTSGIRYVLTLDVGDYDGDGTDDLVGGSHSLGFLPGDTHRLMELSWVSDDC